MKLSDYKLIYISCKFGGDKERVKLCEEFIEEFIKEDKKNGIEGKVYISPLNTFGFLYDKTEYQEGLNMALKLLEKCDEMYVLPDYETSKGCLQEIGFCMALGIPIKYI